MQDRIILGNSAYSRHMTDEGLQLQEGLEDAGWHLHFAEQERNVFQILDTYRPLNVFIQDKRDWDVKSGCPGVTKDLRYIYLNALQRSGRSVAVVVKDGGPDGSEYHEEFCRESGASAVVIYYHPLSILKFSPWLQDFKLIRTHHSLNPQHIPIFTPGSQRLPLCGSGAMLSDVYPLRNRIAPKAKEFGMVWLKHPGYYNDRGSDTPRYLQFLNQFKVSFATSSAYGFSLRKIIESVACGCVVVTDLPKYDVLPEIDRALVRVKPSISDADLKMVFQEAIESWNEDGRKLWAQKAIAYYGYQEVGNRLSVALLKV